MENKDFIIQEIDSDAIQPSTSSENYVKRIDANNVDLGLCWSIKIFKICIKKITSDKIVIEVKVADLIKVATVTLTRKDACATFDESVGGDFAKVDVAVCANFDKKELRAKGKVCASWVCVKFNQKIISW